jgi:hypothetical protein
MTEFLAATLRLAPPPAVLRPCTLDSMETAICKISANTASPSPMAQNT